VIRHAPLFLNALAFLTSASLAVAASAQDASVPPPSTDPKAENDLQAEPGDRREWASIHGG
jgi:hypothetical protein